MINSISDSARYAFIVKEASDGTPYIRLDAVNSDLKVLEKGSLGFNLPKGTDVRKAQEIAAFLKQNLTSTFYYEVRT
jgi:hypothetical protein